MIAVAIASIVILGVSHLIVTFNDEVRSVRDTMDFDEEAFRLQYYFNLPFRNAINVKVVPSSTDIDAYPVPVTGSTAYEGRLRTFDSATSLTTGTNVNTTTSAIAVFARDTASIQTTTAPFGAVTKFSGAGIYFQQPSATSFGILYVTMGDGTTIRPSRNGNFATNLTRVKIENIEESNGYVRSFAVHVWFRYPTTSTPAAINWCPVATPCGTGAPTKDIERTFTINLQNNVDPSTGTQKLPLGRIYFMGRGQ